MARIPSKPTKPSWLRPAIVLILCTLTIYWNRPRGITVANASLPPSRSIPTDYSSHGALTAGQMKQLMKLPCNYVHDGYYVKESNAVLMQVYDSLLKLDDDVVPLIIEAGGHDGITKSVSLKSSICLHMNTMLIEASPPTFEILQQARAYDTAVHAALCVMDDKDDEQFVNIQVHATNSGQTKIASPGNKGDYKVPCTTLDREIESFVKQLPAAMQPKVQLVMLILDVEKHEKDALQGLTVFSPLKAMIETKYMKEHDRKWVIDWAKSKHKLTNVQDDGMDGDNSVFNFNHKIASQVDRQVLYSARTTFVPPESATAIASQAYKYYGQ